MIAIFEIAFLVLLIVLGVWWFRRTNLLRAYRRSGWRDPGQHYGIRYGFSTRVDPPNRQSHRE